MGQMNFWNETQYLMTLPDSNGFNCERVAHEPSEKVRYWFEPGVADISMDRLEEIIGEFWFDHSHYDFSVCRLPEGPVELEVYNRPRGDR